MEIILSNPAFSFCAPGPGQTEPSLYLMALDAHWCPYCQEFIPVDFNRVAVHFHAPHPVNFIPVFRERRC